MIDLSDIDDTDEAGPVDPRSLPCRYSALKQFSQSPLHYWHAMQGDYAESLSMRLGSGAHALLFGQLFAVFEGQRRGKAWDGFRADHAGQLILTTSELGKAEAMVEAIRGNALAMSLLFGPGMQHERRIDWTWNGRAYRSTPDAFGPRVLVDLKCLRSAKPDDVMWQSRKMQYHAQAALYRIALREASLSTVDDCYLVVVENAKPHPVTVMRFTPMALEQGERSLVFWDEQRRACEQANEYPGYVQSIVDLDLPGDDMGDLVFSDDDNSNNGAEE